MTSITIHTAGTTPRYTSTTSINMKDTVTHTQTHLNTLYRPRSARHTSQLMPIFENHKAKTKWARLRNFFNYLYHIEREKRIEYLQSWLVAIIPCVSSFWHHTWAARQSDTSAAHLSVRSCRCPRTQVNPKKIIINRFYSSVNWVSRQKSFTKYKWGLYNCAESHEGSNITMGWGRKVPWICYPPFLVSFRFVSFYFRSLSRNCFRWASSSEMLWNEMAQTKQNQLFLTIDFCFRRSCET